MGGLWGLAAFFKELLRNYYADSKLCPKNLCGYYADQYYADRRISNKANPT